MQLRLSCGYLQTNKRYQPVCPLIDKRKEWAVLKSQMLLAESVLQIVDYNKSTTNQREHRWYPQDHR